MSTTTDMSHALNWPDDQLFLSQQDIVNLEKQCAEKFNATGQSLRLPVDLNTFLTSLYIPLAAWLDRRCDNHPEALVVGICGGQGSGKSTVTELLKSVLEVGFDRRVACFSIDDIYKTKEDRLTLSKRVHPLFQTRGVPFTHDVNLGVETIKRLQANEPSVPLPRFDKAIDTRVAKSEWPHHEGPCDIIILEGWCVGARPQSEQALREPINSLERDEDEKGVWRTTSNKALAGEYHALFSLIDVQLLLEVESMEQVFKWRRLQEHKLKDRVTESAAAIDGLAVMTDAEVDRFVMHYERLTRHILSEMPQRADIVFKLNDSHSAANVNINCPI